ncbi:MAG: complex I NDUFA9 subunit family protein [Mariprofundales bacterium]
MKIKHICIIGGSGFIGQAIVRIARQQGYKISIACRHPERNRHLLVDGVTLYRCDITDGSGLLAAISDADVVINLVGLLFEHGRQNFEAGHVHAAKHILEACKQAGIKRYFHMSALGAASNSASSYARTKAQAEEEIRRSSLAWTIFRPSIVYGAGDNFFNQFKTMATMLPVLPVISGATRFQPIWVEDVARAFVHSIGDRHTIHCTYELAGPEVIEFRQLLATMLTVLELKRPLIALPNFVAKIIATFGQFLPTPPLTPDQLKLLAQDNVTDAEFPAIFGTVARLEDILPTFIHGSNSGRAQKRFDSFRKDYWKNS